MRNRKELRAFLARILGWEREHVVEHALRSVELAANGHAALLLCGDGDMVHLAWSLHRRISDPDQPFVVCDPRRGTQPTSVRSPASRGTLADAREAAEDGTLCLSLRRPPPDLAESMSLFYAAEDTMLILCATEPPVSMLALRPAPVVVPSLASRAAELDRIIAEYAADAIAELGSGAFTAADCEWVLQNAATSLDEIDKATRRIAAVRGAANTSAAATQLGMTLVSLSRWLARRGGI
jgi:hypothetical protein